MGLTGCYKTAVFFTVVRNMIDMWATYQAVRIHHSWFPWHSRTVFIALTSSTADRRVTASVYSNPAVTFSVTDKPIAANSKTPV